MSEYEKNVVEQVEKLGDTITLMEKICKSIEDLNPVLYNKEKSEIRKKYRIFETDEEYPAITSPFLRFISFHKSYTILYNEMRDNLFELLSKGYKVVSGERFGI